MRLFGLERQRRMSPAFIIVLMVCVLLVVAIVVGGLLLWVNSKTPATEEMFASAAQTRGLALERLDLEALQMDTNVFQAACIAQGNGFQIEFYELADAGTAKRLQASAIGQFEEDKGSSSARITVNLGKFGSYALTTNGSYYYSAYIENTLVIASAGEEYKAEVSDFVKELGY